MEMEKPLPKEEAKDGELEESDEGAIAWEL